MRTISQAAIVVATAAIAAASGSPSSGQSTQPQSPSGLIVGQVVDGGSGKPVSGAIVRILGSQPVWSSAVPAAPPAILTGPDGRFVFRNLARGNYGITVSKNGYAEGAHGRRRPGGPSVPLTLADGERTSDAVLRLWKHATISGTVVDEAGEPVVGARVRARRRGFIRGRHTFVVGPMVATDDRGMYRLTGLLPGEYLVSVPQAQSATFLMQRMEPGRIQGVLERAGTAPVPPPSTDGRRAIYPATYHPAVTVAAQALLTTVASGEERLGIDVQMQPVSTARVSGTVSRPEGPVSGISMRLVLAGNEDLVEDGTPATSTDGQGAFSFAAVPAGQYSLRVNVALLADEKTRLLTTLWAEVPLVVAGADLDGIVVTPSNGSRIIGRLEFEGSRLKAPAGTVGQIPLVIDPVDRTLGLASSSIRVDTNGQFTTGGLPPGRYFVRVSGSPVGWMFKSATHNGRDVSETPLELHGEDVHVVLTYTDRWTGIAGTVTSQSGSPDPDAIVLAFPAEPDLWSGYGAAPRRLKSTRTRKTGEYNFNSLPPGRYHLVAVPDEHAADWQDPAFLQMLARISTAVTIGEGEQTTRSLRTQVIR